MRLSPARLVLGFLALALAALSIWRLEETRAGIERTALVAERTPMTLYSAPGADGPLVVIAHGFAGSRQLMEAISLTLARGGYRVLAFDFEGHGRNPVPMSGDVTSIDGTTARLVDETQRVIAAGRAATGWQGPVALVGHSMATDVVIRTARKLPDPGPVVAISMYSEAVTARFPANLLIVTGAWEPGLRPVALDALRMVDPAAQEGQTARSGDVLRRAVVAPHVEHAGVLFSTVTLAETRRFLDAAFGRVSDAPVAATGGWIALLLGAVVGLGWCLSGVLAQRREAAPVSLGAFALATILPALVAPLVATQVRTDLLPVLVADYLALHLLIFGAVQLSVLWFAGLRLARPGLWPTVALVAFGIGVFGLALDRYVASFVPTGLRLGVMAALSAGTVPFMLADALITQTGRAALWRRLSARLAFLASLATAAALDFERLMFLVIIMPVIVLFYAVFGVMGRGVGMRAGSGSAGLGLGLILAWSLAAAFPLFRV